MPTLVLVHRGETTPHEVAVAGWEPVAVDEELGIVAASVHGGNVLLRVGSPGPDYRDEMTVHDGETCELVVDGPLYARAFTDRAVGDF